MDAKQLAEIKAREQAATPGPWEYECFGRYEDHDECILKTETDECEISAKEDAEFIAHARTDIPALVAEVEQLQTAQLKAFNAGYDVQQKHLDETVRQYGAEIDRLAGERDKAIEECIDIERINRICVKENIRLRKALMQAIRDGHTNLSPDSHQKLFDYYIQREQKQEESKL